MGVVGSPNQCAASSALHGRRPPGREGCSPEGGRRLARPDEDR
ncbi:hypothetical protein A176_007196 [Myxococcus hansupus]|uniref:Uncharacterized protein n=1 Tax=Pseudomyxococcus hansupus TaxID=1297742 RepID=A0A0H4X4X3_9BACT|nr:hypothetical protein A176_007196 [Myxococcus hansupus]